MKKLALLLTSIVIFTACNKIAPSPQTQSEVKIETENLEQLIASGKSVKCEVKKSDGSEAMMTYMMGKKIKTIGITSTDKTYQGMMISDGETV